MIKYSIWNNKGGTGKTSLAFQMICRFSQLNPSKKILVVDVCPQANLSELMLGGLENEGSKKLFEQHNLTPRRTIGGYFDARLPSPFSPPAFNPIDYILSPYTYNENIPENIDLVCGDPLLEIQAIAMNTLANAALPGVNAWLGVIDWIKDFLDKVSSQYDYVFMDTNPSFSMYTQIALSASDRIMLPVMPDDSSRRAIQNAVSLIYGVKLPSDVYKSYTFAAKLAAASRSFPKIHLILKNRITQYMGEASAYTAVLSGIVQDINDLLKLYPSFFTFSKSSDGIVSIRDFQTAGVVAFAKGCQFSTMKTGRVQVSCRKIQVKPEYRKNSLDAIDAAIAKI